MNGQNIPEVFRKPDMKRGRRAAIYIRISDVSGREDTYISDEIQIARCSEYAAGQGMEIVKVVSDIGLSGESSKKRQIASMIEEVRQGLYDTIIVWKWSRWGRNLQDSMINMALLEEAGGYLVAATEPVEVTTPAGVFARTQFLAMAQLQLDQIRESWRDSHRNRLEKGLPHTGARYFGYEYHPEAREKTEKYTPHPVQFAALREGYLMYISGKSHRTIGKHWNSKGIFTNPRNGHTGEGKLWVPSMVRQVLDSGFGAGRITYNTKAKGLRPAMSFEMYSNNWEHAITDEEWDAYLARRKDVVDRLPPKTAGQKTMLKGLCYCSHCGRRLSLYKTSQTRNGKTGRTSYVYANWRCCGVANEECKGVAIRDHILQAAVRRWVEGLASGMDQMPELVARKMRTQRAEGAVTAIDQNIAYVTSQKKEGVRLVIKGVLTEEEFTAQKEEYDKTLAELEEARAAHQREVNVNAVPPEDAFGALLMAIDQKMDEDGLNIGLKTAIHKILVHPLASGGDRVQIIPRWEAPDLEVKAV